MRLDKVFNIFLIFKKKKNYNFNGPYNAEPFKIQNVLTMGPCI